MGIKKRGPARVMRWAEPQNTAAPGGWGEGVAGGYIRDRESTLSAHRGPPGLVATIGDPRPRSIRRTAHFCEACEKAGAL